MCTRDKVESAFQSFLQGQSLRSLAKFYGIPKSTLSLKFRSTDGDDSSPSCVGAWSAACLVGRYSKTHYDVFMPTLIGSGQRKFDTAVIKGITLWNWCKSKGYLK